LRQIPWLLPLRLVLLSKPSVLLRAPRKRRVASPSPHSLFDSPPSLPPSCSGCRKRRALMKTQSMPSRLHRKAIVRCRPCVSMCRREHHSSTLAWLCRLLFCHHLFLRHCPTLHCYHHPSALRWPARRKEFTPHRPAKCRSTRFATHRENSRYICQCIDLQTRRALPIVSRVPASTCCEYRSHIILFLRFSQAPLRNCS
jgi:hypothetical protein